MRMTFLTAAAAALISTAAFAASDEGPIASVDRAAMTITLENGNTYRLPGEFDLDALSEGQDVFLAYEAVEGENQITDIDLGD